MAQQDSRDNPARNQQREYIKKYIELTNGLKKDIDTDRSNKRTSVENSIVILTLEYSRKSSAR